MSIIDHHGFNFYSGPVLPVQDISAATFIIHSWLLIYIFSLELCVFLFLKELKINSINLLYWSYVIYKVSKPVKSAISNVNLFLLFSQDTSDTICDAKQSDIWT